MFNSRAASWLRRRRPELRLGVRMTVAGVVSYALAVLLGLPQGYWAVFTAVLVSQASVGGSIKATLERLAGTFSGAFYGAAVATLVPHGDPLALGIALAISLTPLAILAALNPMFRVAPMTAIILLLGPPLGDQTPVEAAVLRMLEVVLGGTVALVVSLTILPARAHMVTGDRARKVLALLDRLLRELVAGLRTPLDRPAISALHQDVQAAFDKLETAAEEASRERRTHLTEDEGADAIPRTLRRLYHDLVLLGRIVGEPMPIGLRERLTAPLSRLADSAGSYLRAIGEALARRSAPPLDIELQHLFARSLAEIRTLEHEAPEQAGAHVAVEFALEHMQRNLRDLRLRASEFARGGRSENLEREGAGLLKPGQ